MKIYLIRHGETDFNRRGVVQGGGVDSDLNELGRKQSEAFFQHYRDIAFDSIYVSPLKRTHQTMQLWKERLGYALQVEDGLTELGWGVLEGKIPTEEETRDFYQLKQNWQNGRLDLAVDGGESPLQCWNRLNRVLDKLKRQHSEQTILICSHGRTSRVLLSKLVGDGLHDMERFNHSNTGLNVLQLGQNDQFSVELLNDTTHLNGTGLNEN
ncbi:histidine phosphatase family protein [bacterium]|nr:histidine phosphatase family protein [bacterium]